MLNNYNNIKLGSNSQTVNFNAPCTGILQRSHPKSRFTNFKHNERISNEVFPLDGSNARICTYHHSHYQSENQYKEITILQTMLYGDNMFFIEYVFNEDLIEKTENKE